jgi:protein-tyrosine-phosphatase
MIRAVRKEINYFLIELGEKKPWLYAQYHCGTASNMYSRVHWGFYPAGYNDRNNNVPANILVVCLANQCRSPMAAAILRDLVAKDELLSQYRITVDSAGFMYNEGLPAMEGAVDEMKKRKLDIEGHTSKCIASVDMEKYDLILTMEACQRDDIIDMYPSLKNRVHLLTEYAGHDGDVSDPTETGLYSRCAAELTDYLSKAVTRMKESMVGSVESINGIECRLIEVPKISPHSGHGVDLLYGTVKERQGKEVALGFIKEFTWIHKKGEDQIVYVLSPDSEIWDEIKQKPEAVMRDLTDCIGKVLNSRKGALLGGQITPNVYAHING